MRHVQRLTAIAFVGVVVACLLPSAASAQGPAASAPAGRRAWIVAGGGSSTLLGDCDGCDSGNYLHSGGLLGNVGLSINSRTDVGAELFWTSNTIPSGDHVRVTFLMAAVQFRPWQSRGFFLKAGAGMAFMRNWLAVIEEEGERDTDTAQALGLGLGAGWEWRTRTRFGFQVFGTQHVAALGDLDTSLRTIENVVGNFWSAGAAIVIR